MRDWENSSPSNLDLSDPRDVLMRRTDCLSGLVAKSSEEGMYLGNLSFGDFWFSSSGTIPR